MARHRLHKFFGIGPMGAVISPILLAVAIRADLALGHPEICGYRSLTEIPGALLIWLVGYTSIPFQEWFKDLPYS